jgi:hypothetical protein
MSTVTMARTVVVVGMRPRSSAAEALADVRPGEESAVLVLGLQPTPAQQRLMAEALSLAAERRFALSAELISAPAALRDRLLDGDEVRVLARPREARRWGITRSPTLSAPGA